MLHIRVNDDHSSLLNQLDSVKARLDQVYAIVSEKEDDINTSTSSNTPSIGSKTRYASKSRYSDHIPTLMSTKPSPIPLMSIPLNNLSNSGDTPTNSSDTKDDQPLATLSSKALVFTNSNASDLKIKPRQYKKHFRAPPKPKGNPRSLYKACAFCDYFSCRNPVDCALEMPYVDRMHVHAQKGLCRDFRCIKAHTGPCKRPKLQCSFCSGSHHRVYCQSLAIKHNLG